MNPVQMKSMMRQFGIKSEDLDAKMVVIETTDGKKIVFDSPQVTCIDMKGQKSYTITGEGREEKGESKTYAEEDVDIIMQQTRSTREQAIAALEENEVDLASALASLKKE